MMGFKHFCTQLLTLIETGRSSFERSCSNNLKPQPASTDMHQFQIMYFLIAFDSHALHKDSSKRICWYAW